MVCWLSGFACLPVPTFSPESILTVTVNTVRTLNTFPNSIPWDLRNGWGSVFPLFHTWPPCIEFLAGFPRMSLAHWVASGCSVQHSASGEKLGLRPLGIDAGWLYCLSVTAVGAVACLCTKTILNSLSLFWKDTRLIQEWDPSFRCCQYPVLAPLSKTVYPNSSTCINTRNRCSWARVRVPPVAIGKLGQITIQ